MGLSLFLYNLFLLLGLVVLFPIGVAYLLAVPKSRAGFKAKMGFLPSSIVFSLKKKTEQPRIWLHAVSVGEFNAIKPLITDLRSEMDIVVSTTTKTGHDLAVRTFPDMTVLYFPYDFGPAIRRILNTVQPNMVVITETELWPNFIHHVSSGTKSPLIFINGRLSARSYQRYQWIKPVIGPTLKRVTHWYMQSQADAERIKNLGGIDPDRITVAGNLKFDLIPHIEPAQCTQLRHLLNITPGDSVLVCASTHSGEEPPLLDAYIMLQKDFPELKLILAPRHPERLASIKSLLNARAVSYSVRSQLTAEQPNQQPIVVLDSIGELLTVYSFARVAVMGGSFVEKGGQNPLEALSQRVPVIFGPHMENFSEISRIILDAEAGFQVHSQSELINAVTGLLTQPEIYDTVAEKGLQLLENNRGAKQMLQVAIKRLAQAKL